MNYSSSSEIPARFRHAVVFCTDQGYLPFALFAASQIIDSHPNREFDIVIATMDDLDIPESLGHLDIRICKITTGGAFSGLNLDDRRTESVYLRLALPGAFADDYDRLLYLDCDIFIQGGDFASLIAMDLQNHAIAAVRDAAQWRNPKRRPTQFRTFGWPSERYFNSGVMLIDIQAWLSQDITAQAIEIGHREIARLSGHDQNLLNCTLRGDWLELSPIWNWQLTRKSMLFEVLVNANIAHFIGRIKPWKDPKSILPPRFADRMMPFLKQHFPDLPFDPPSASPLSNLPKTVSMFFRGLMNVRKMHRYMARFPGRSDIAR